MRGFATDSLVTMVDGVLKPIQSIKAYDYVLSAAGTPVEVEGIEKEYYEGQVPYIDPVGCPMLLVTHPEQKTYMMSYSEWTRIIEKRRFHDDYEDTEEVVNSIEFRKEARLMPRRFTELDRKDRIARVLYTQKTSGFQHDPDMAFFLGVYAPRGHVDDSGLIQIRFPKDDACLMTELDVLLSMWEVQFSQSSNNLYIINDEWLRSVIKEYIGGELVEERYLSPAIMTMSLDTQLRFLQGYFGDNPKLRVGIRSLKLIMQLQMLLDRNRIKSSLFRGHKVRFKDGLKRHSYQVRVSDFYAAKLARNEEQKVTVASNQKQDSVIFIGDRGIIPVGPTRTQTYKGFFYRVLTDHQPYVVNSIAVCP